MSQVVEAAAAVALKALGGRPGDTNRYALDRAQRLVRSIDAIAAATPEAERPERLDLAKIAAMYSCLPYLAGGTPGNRGTARDDAAELAADQLKDRLGAEELELTLRILREHQTKATKLPEARLLSDAISLEDFGLIGLWNQTRAHHAAGKTLDQLLRLWRTQHEYGYWETRLHEGFHFAAARDAAQRRNDALHTIFDRMSREQAATDIGRSGRS